MCRNQPGIAIGRLCEKDDGRCVVCDSLVRPCTLVRICDECNYGSGAGKCVICGGPGISDAYYCKECTIQEKDRGKRYLYIWFQSHSILDGCPKIVNLGSSKTDLFYERKKYGFKKR
jgi:PHD finger-like domain-containing protein 5A